MIPIPRYGRNTYLNVISYPNMKTPLLGNQGGIYCIFLSYQGFIISFSVTRVPLYQTPKLEKLQGEKLTHMHARLPAFPSILVGNL